MTAVKMARVATQRNLGGVSTIAGIQFRWPAVADVIPPVDPDQPSDRHNTIFVNMPVHMIEEEVRFSTVRVMGKLPNLDLPDDGPDFPNMAKVAEYDAKHPYESSFLTSVEFKALGVKKRNKNPYS